MHPFIHLGPVTLPVYGLCMAAGLLIAALIAFLRAPRFDINKYDLIVVAAVAVGLGLIGAKVTYLVASYGLDRVLADIRAGEWTFMSSGGQVYLGGLIGGVIGGLATVRILKASVADYCDVVVPAIPLGHAFGRIGCHFAGCCYGMPYEGPLCVSYPYIGVENVFPVQLVEAAAGIVMFAVLMVFARRKRSRYATLRLYMLMYAAVRFCLEFLRGDAIRGIAAGLSTSQWISVAMFAVAIIPLFIRRPAH